MLALNNGTTVPPIRFESFQGEDGNSRLKTLPNCQ